MKKCEDCGHKLRKIRNARNRYDPEWLCDNCLTPYYHPDIIELKRKEQDGKIQPK